MLTFVLYALVVIAVFTALEGVLLLVSGDPTARKRAVQQRLQRHASRITDALDDGYGGILINQESENSLLKRLSASFSKRRELELLLYRAGMPYTPPQIFGLTLICSMAGLLLGVLLLDSVLLGVLLLSIGAFPWISVILRKRRRMAAFESQMPEALDLICRALRAGISLEFGFRSVGDELPDPIATEFCHVADEVSLGLDTRIALQNLATRMNTSDMPFFVNAILIQRETGGNLAEILDNLSHIIRERIKFYGKVRTLVAQVNLSANLLAVLPIALAFGLSVLSPGYLDPLFEPPGLYFLYGACAAVPVGWLLCRRIASVGA